MDKSQYTSISLDELRRIEAEAHRAESIDELRALFERLQSIRRTFIDDFDIQIAIAQVQQAIVEHGRALVEGHYDPRQHGLHVPAPAVPYKPVHDALSETTEPEPAPKPLPLPPDVEPLDARSWKRATYIGAFFAIILFALFFYLVQTARKLNLSPEESQGGAANQAKNVPTAQQKPKPGTPESAPPPPSNPALRLYTDLVPGTVSVDGAPPRPLQDGELQLDALKPGHHSVKLAGLSGNASVEFDSVEKNPPKLTAQPVGNNAMVVAVSANSGNGYLMTNAQNARAFVDGKEIGLIPPGGIALTGLGQADHELQIRQATDSERFILTYTSAPALTVFIKNDLNAGTLVVQTGQDSVDVFVDDQKYRRQTDHGQLRMPVLKVGKHTIKVAKQGFGEVPPQTVEIKKGEEARVVFHLEPVPQQLASLSIRGTQPGTQIFVDGKPAGSAGADGNAAVPNLNPGDHKIELRHEGSAPKVVQRPFKSGENVELSGADVLLTKLPPQQEHEPVPPPPAEPAAEQPSQPAPTGTEAQPSSIPASIHKGGGFLIFHSPKPPGRYAFSLQLRKGGGFLKSKRLQWFAGYQDTKNYVVFQVDGKHFTVRQVVDGKSEELRKETFDADPEDYVQIEMTVNAHSVAARLRSKDGEWQNMGAVTGIETDVTQGKFGVLIPGSDEVGISSVRFSK